MADDFVDFYKLLDVPTTADADDIKGAHRAKSAKHHPDKHAGREVANVHQTQLNVAADTLLDSSRRARHDAELERRSATEQGEQPPQRRVPPPRHPRSQSRVEAALSRPGSGWIALGCVVMAIVTAVLASIR